MHESQFRLESPSRTNNSLEEPHDFQFPASSTGDLVLGTPNHSNLL